MRAVVNRRVFLERANALVRKAAPDLNDVSSACEALTDVLTDLIGAPCRIVVKVDAKALDAAIRNTEAAEKARTH
jgi:hypothetical protein